MRDLTAPRHMKAVRFKAEDIRADGTFTGYGSVFGVEDGGGDVVLPGAFSASLAEHKAAGTMPKLLWQHNPHEPIGAWAVMHEDSHGLLCEGKLLTTCGKGREAYELMRMGAIDGLSIGYDCQEWEIETDGEVMPGPVGPYGMPYGGGGQVRRLKKISLWEVSVVTFPMNTDARVATVRSRGVDPLTRAKRRRLDEVLDRYGTRRPMGEMAGVVAAVKARGAALAMLLGRRSEPRKGLFDWLLGDNRDLTGDGIYDWQDQAVLAREALARDAAEIDRLIADGDLAGLEALDRDLRDFGDGSNPPDVEQMVNDLLERIEEGIAQIVAAYAQG